MKEKHNHYLLTSVFVLLMITAPVLVQSFSDRPPDLWGWTGSHIYNNNPGYVGVGTDVPITTLDVAGEVHIRDRLQIAGWGIDPPLTTVPFEVTGTAAPQYFTPIARISATEGNAALGISRGDEEDASQLFLGYVDVGWVIEDVGLEHRLDFGDGVGSMVSLLPTDEAEGNVGIGTTAPTAKLHVAGSIRVDGDEGGQAETITLTDTVITSDTLSHSLANAMVDRWLKVYIDEDPYYFPLLRKPE